MPVSSPFVIRRLRSEARWFAVVLLSAWLLTGHAWTAPPRKTQSLPHNQDHMPGPPLSPEEAIKKMTVPDGFAVELVAAEPDIVNPTAMTFDERGRVWIAESLEYPRKSAGPGRDRIKILEDTDGDGKMDKFTVFAEGLNIPSGIAVGHGGVWVANSPDILFYKIGADGKAVGKPEVVVSGFGRSDTHELPNSLTWGPDGWLYGLNGVFNRSRVTQHGQTFDFTCALFRIHPKTREFQLFCQGTSNPWGLAWDNEGSAFVSACVIDHLWHLTETGYYHRQGGPYPPFTWKLGSIVRHRHQKAAYCGLHFFDSDAYPPQYREKLYMGNIHGNCINCDELTRDGSTYFAKPRPDFLTAHDSWFMPVAQKTGPDGCLYILDWYDRYHCYQDANRDPKGIDRLRGRLYRIRYKNTPRAPKFDLTKETDEQLIQHLYNPNVFFRDLAQQLLCERNHPATRTKLQKLVFDEKNPRKTRMHALWSLIGAESLDPAFHQHLLAHRDSGYRAWGVRAAGNMGKVQDAIKAKVLSLSRDPSPNVRLQVAIAAGKIDGVDSMATLVEVLSASGEDKLIPVIVWQNLHPLLENEAERFLTLATNSDVSKSLARTGMMPRVVERILGRRQPNPELLAKMLAFLIEGKTADLRLAGQCLRVLAEKVQNGDIIGQRVKRLRLRFAPQLRKWLQDTSPSTLRLNAALLAVSLKESLGGDIVRRCCRDPKQPESLRLHALEALIAAEDKEILDTVSLLLADRNANSATFRGQILGALGKLNDKRVAEIVLSAYPSLEPKLRPRAVELLTQRNNWAKQLVHAVAGKKISASMVSVNQVRKLLAGKDAELAKQVKAIWGVVRAERNPQREKVVKDMNKYLRAHRGDAKAGVVVFRKLCAQCHKIYGEGFDVGPDLTGNGRGSFDQLISNVFDPNLVIGAAYQATTVQTVKGRSLTGLIVENNERHVVLKTQGGKLETVPRQAIDEISVSPVSLMPEGIEKQLTSKEIADLFDFLSLDKPPNDPTAQRIPGAPR